MKIFPAVTDWQMPVYVPFETATQPLNGVATFYSWVQFRNQSPSALLPCPYDHLDTVYPPVVIDFWLSAFLQEAQLDNGGHLDSLSLQNALGDIQSHILKTYGAQAISVYDLPNTAKVWKTLVLLQPPPMLQPWPKEDPPTTSGLPVIHSGLPMPDSLPGISHQLNNFLRFREYLFLLQVTTGTSSKPPTAKRARFAPPLQPDDLKQLEKPPIPQKNTAGNPLGHQSSTIGSLNETVKHLQCFSVHRTCFQSHTPSNPRPVACGIHHGSKEG